MKVHPAIKSISVESLHPLTATRINDDDWYTYDDATGIVVSQRSSKGPRPQCAPGQYVVSGLSIKLSGLCLFNSARGAA